MPLHVSLKQFDGPLDLLMHLITKAKVDIKDIFVSEITDQYIESVHNDPDLNMDDATEFLVMAATLLEIKSRAMLPKPPAAEEDGEDLEQALIRRLEEYKIFKETAENMQEFEKAAAAMYQKLPEEYPLPPPTLEIAGLTLEGLVEALRRVLERKPSAQEEEAAHPIRDIRRDEHTVKECMLHILKKLRKGGQVAFHALLSAAPTKEEVVTLFLALLEILRLGKAHIQQTAVFDEITLLPGRRPESAA